MIRYRFYRVGRERFANKFLAYLHASNTGRALEFDFFQETFDQADWRREPESSWDDLLDTRARQIANLKRPIILGFSGGTDSLTMYQVFRRNNIRIDALFLKIKDDTVERPMYEKVLQFMEAERVVYGFKIITSTENRSLLDHIYATPDWWQSELPVRIQFSVATGLYDIETISGYDNNIPTDFVFVMGMDKPRLRIKNGRFYSYLQDTTFLNYCDPRHEYFFSTPDLPELHIKQSYMLARYIRSLSVAQNRPIEHYENINNPRCHDYLDYSIRGCGRFGDLANSQQQKLMNRYCDLTIENNHVRYNGRSSNALLSGIADDSAYAVNYLAGLRAIRADSKLRTIFRDEQNYYSVIDIDSKHYELSI